MVVSVRPSEGRVDSGCADEGSSESVEGSSESVSVEYVGDVVRSLREEHGISARDLCERAEISPMQLWRIERRKASPTEDTIRKVACALGVPAARLFGATPIVSLADEGGGADWQGARAKFDHTRQRLGDIQRQLGDMQRQLEVLVGDDSAGVSARPEARVRGELIWQDLPHDQAEYPRFRVICVDAVGRLAEVTDIFRQSGVNIRSIAAMDESDSPAAAIDESDSPVERHIVISIAQTERERLQDVAESLVRIDGVIRVVVAVRSPDKE